LFHREFMRNRALPRFMRPLLGNSVLPAWRWDFRPALLLGAGREVFPSPFYGRGFERRRGTLNLRRSSARKFLW
jgi:hypothetical protein